LPVWSDLLFDIALLFISMYLTLL